MAQAVRGLLALNVAGSVPLVSFAYFYNRYDTVAPNSLKVISLDRKYFC